MPKKESGAAVFEPDESGEGFYETHPAYGVAMISRISGHQKLFGTEISTVPTVMQLDIRLASMHHDDRLHMSRVTERHGLKWRDRNVVTLRFSAAQFAELITSIGVVPGVGCTITTLHGEDMPAVPEDHQTPLDRIRAHIGTAPLDAEADQAAKDLAALLNDHMPKRKIGLAIGLLELVAKSGRRKSEWALEMFKEKASEMVGAAKLEVHAAMQSVLTALGRAAFGSAPQELQLTDGEDEE